MKRLASVWCAGRLVTEPFLDGAGVVLAVGEGEAAGMSEHVGMDRKAELGRHPNRRELLPEAGRGHRRARSVVTQVRGGEACSRYSRCRARNSPSRPK